MKIIIRSIEMPICHTEREVIEAAQEIVRLRCVSVKNLYIYKQSLDARRKNNIHYVYSVAADTDSNVICDGKIICESKGGKNLEIPNKSLLNKPVVIGTGPCGLFAAYILAKSGNPPIVFERGECVESRKETVKFFWENGIFNANSNVQFGEGGAGTFSDGKLNSGINDPFQRYVLEIFAKHGAPQDILYKAKPHIGTDKLCEVVKSMREEIIRLGGEIRFNSCLTNINVRGGGINEIEINNSETIKCRTLIIAIGHSSRDTYAMLNNSGVYMEAKPFAAGVRIEHSQSMINMSQYGCDDPHLPPADYKLVYNGAKRSCYSFCMCPGGQVVNASSEIGYLTVNGMSEYHRDGENANSALVVPVRPDDFEGRSPLEGIEFQRRYEKLAFEIGKGSAPVQLARDFLKDKISDSFSGVLPSFTGKTVMADLRKCLPQFITEEIKCGLNDFEHKIKGFALGDGVLTGVEMRTSAPVRIVRGADMQSTNVKGLYPAGEGAGYAGGIVSAAVDGIKCALTILSKPTG